VAEAVRAALGLQPGDLDAGDLADAAKAVNAAAGATRMDGGSLVLLAARLAGRVRAEPGGPTAEAARAALADAWPVTTHRDLADLAAMLLAFCATWATDEQIAQAAAIGAELP